MRPIWLAIATALLLAAEANAAIKPAALFSDNMVLQQGQKVPVWGTADNGQEVTVKIQDQSATAKAEGGKWRVTLDSLKSGGPYEMTIGSGDAKITLKNILVGEVWIASGQSNMQWPVKQSADPDKTIAESANPMIRLFNVPREASDTPAMMFLFPTKTTFMAPGWSVAHKQLAIFQPSATFSAANCKRNSAFR